MPAQTPIIPHRRSPAFCRLARWYAQRLVRRSFHALRMAHGGADVLDRLDSHDGPTIVLLNHQSWWDPILSAALVRRFAPRRRVHAPMERRMLERFAFMRRLGLFGVDLDDPGAFGAAVGYAAGLCLEDRRASLWVTPQGSFADVRAPLRLRPGSAAVAASLCRSGRPPAVACLAVELVFWEDRRPEALTLARACPSPARPTATASWHRVMTASLRTAMDELASLAIARDPAGFEALLGERSGGAHPVYDLYQRLMGRGRTVEPAGRREHAEPAP